MLQIPASAAIDLLSTADLVLVTDDDGQRAIASYQGWRDKGSKDEAYTIGAELWDDLIIHTDDLIEMDEGAMLIQGCRVTPFAKVTPAIHADPSAWSVAPGTTTDSCPLDIVSNDGRSCIAAVIGFTRDTQPCAATRAHAALLAAAPRLRALLQEMSAQYAQFCADPAEDSLLREAREALDALANPIMPRTAPVDLVATMRQALQASVPALERLGDFVGNIDQGGASGLGRIDRCAVLRTVRDAIDIAQR